MTFQSTTTMPPNPPIRIFFHGLIVLDPPDGKSCVAEIHRDNTTHTPSIEVRAKVPGQADFIVMRRFGHLSGRHPALSIRGDKGTSGTVFKYQPTTAFDPVNPINGEQDDDFRWAINLEHRDFHGRDLKVETTKTRPSVVLENGLFYFHTALIKKDDIDVFQGTTFKRRIKGLASVVGANLDLADGGVAVLSGNGFDDLPLPKPADNRTSYEIYIDNSPLYEPPGAGASHSEMKEYYKVLKKASPNDIPVNEQFKLAFSSAFSAKAATDASQEGSSKFDTRFASIRIPCMPIILDGNG